MVSRYLTPLVFLDPETGPQRLPTLLLGFTITMVKTIVFVSIIIILFFLSFFPNEVYRTYM